MVQTALDSALDYLESQSDSSASSILSWLGNEATNGTLAGWQNETVPPDVFHGGTFSPGFLENFTLPPDVDPGSLPWFLEGSTLAPEIHEGGTLPPWLMANDTLAPGLLKDGELDPDFILDWTKDLLPNMSSFSLTSDVIVEPVFLSLPVIQYERVSSAALSIQWHGRC